MLQLPLTTARVFSVGFPMNSSNGSNEAEGWVNKKKKQPHTELQRLLQSTSFAMMLATPKCQVPPFPSIYLITPYTYNSTDPVVIFSSFISNGNSYQNTEKLYPVPLWFWENWALCHRAGQSTQTAQQAPVCTKSAENLSVCNCGYCTIFSVWSARPTGQ